MSKNVKIVICQNSVFCKKKIIRMTNVNSFRFLRSKLFQNHGKTLRKSIATFKSFYHVKGKPYTANDCICGTSDQTQSSRLLRCNFNDPRYQSCCLQLNRFRLHDYEMQKFSVQTRTLNLSITRIHSLYKSSLDYTQQGVIRNTLKRNDWLNFRKIETCFLIRLFKLIELRNVCRKISEYIM